ncbi:MAG: hypothetical protein LBR32_06840 [Propionibacteriaceae bacterium]|jgi:hypothetical protein|nr:hypothetical protein [Propionibacteriaceae bacterium]
MRNVITIGAALIGALCLAWSFLIYKPGWKGADEPSTPAQTQLMGAATKMASADGPTREDFLGVIGKGSDSPWRDINLTDVTAEISDPVLRPDGNLLILSLEVRSITNHSGKDLEFAASAFCGTQWLSDDDSGSQSHYVSPVPFVFVEQFETIPGYEWYDGAKWGAEVTWAKTSDNKYIYTYSGNSLFRTRRPGLLKSVDCKAGPSKSNAHDLKTDFVTRPVKAGESPTLSTQNVLEFVIPPAPSFVSEEVKLSESAYPYVFGGLYLVSTDYSAAAFVPLM